MYIEHVVQQPPVIWKNHFPISHTISYTGLFAYDQGVIDRIEDDLQLSRKILNKTCKQQGKAVPLQTWSGPEGSRKLRFPDFVTTAQDGGKFVSLTHLPSLPLRNTPGTHFCYRLSRPQDHSAIGRILCQWKIQWHQLELNQRLSDL